MQRVIISSFQIRSVSKIFLSGAWKDTALILTLKTPYCTLLWSMYYLNFREKIDLDSSYQSSISRQFTWNVVPYLIPRTATNFKSVVCFLWACESNRVSFNYCVRNVWFILKAQWKNVVLISTQRTHDKVICCGIYMEFKNTQHGAWYLWSMTRQK